MPASSRGAWNRKKESAVFYLVHGQWLCHLFKHEHFLLPPNRQNVLPGQARLVAWKQQDGFQAVVPKSENMCVCVLEQVWWMKHTNAEPLADSKVCAPSNAATCERRTNATPKRKIKDGKPSIWKHRKPTGHTLPRLRTINSKQRVVFFFGSNWRSPFSDNRVSPFQKTSGPTSPDGLCLTKAFSQHVVLCVRLSEIFQELEAKPMEGQVSTCWEV